MIEKETARKLFNQLPLSDNDRVDESMFNPDAEIIFDFFYTLMDEEVKKEVRRREEALLECHRLKAANEEKLLAILRMDRNKKIEFMYGLDKSVRRPDVFREPYIRALMDVLFKYKDLHPEIKQSDLEAYKKQQKNKASDLEAYRKKLNTNTDPITFEDKTVVNPDKVILKNPIMIKENKSEEDDCPAGGNHRAGSNREIFGMRKCLKCGKLI